MEPVFAGTARYFICAFIAVDPVISSAAGKGVGPFAARKAVIAAPALQIVVACVTVEAIFSIAPFQGIVAAPP